MNTKRTTPCSRLPRGCLSALALAACAAPTTPSETSALEASAPVVGPADLVFTNGRVYTLDWGEPDREGRPAPDAPHDDAGWHPDAQAVAVRDGRIAYVGDDAGVAAHVGPRTRVVDLGGAVLLPGLVDSHTHVAELGRNRSRLSLIGIATEQEAVERVAALAASTPEGSWILGHGWDEGDWADRYPTRALLSERVPDHPVVLRGLHGFAVWGNDLALERAGIGAASEAPTGGEILRDPSGAPTGVLLNRATGLLTDAVPEPSAEQLREHLRAGLAEMARSGYVAVHEAGVGRETLAALVSLDEAGELSLRFYAMLSARDEALCREWLARGPQVGGERLFVRAVKAYYDGALGSRGARLLADYADRPGQRGVSGSEYGFDRELLASMMNAGFQVAIHAIGDAGNRETLEFLERVALDDPAVLAGRHRVEHAQVVHPDDFGRFAALGLIASMEPPHAMEDKAWAEDRLGPERVRGAYAWRTFRRYGVALAFNSDLPGSDHDPFYGLHSAIARKDREGRPAGGWFPEQRMSAEEALRGYTSWGAYAAFLEEHTGRIAAGRWADLTALDRDPLVLGERAPGDLLGGRVLLTVVGGEVLYEDLRP